MTKKAPTYSIIHRDCRKQMLLWNDQGLKPMLAVADPPFNLGRNYDICQDDKPVAEYLAWTKEWAHAMHKLLHRNGSLWVAIYPNLVSEVDVVMKAAGFHKHDHIIWAFTFGQNNQNGLTQAHTHWLYYRKTPSNAIFNGDDPAVRLPSARQLLYKDKRANPNGRLPDNVWVLNLNMIKDELPGNMNFWVESRVAGTFKERIKGSDNQMPRAVIDRIVRLCSNEGDLVVDPFGGTFTTVESCLALGRNVISCDLSKAYCERGEERIKRFLQQRSQPATTKEKTRAKPQAERKSKSRTHAQAHQNPAHRQNGRQARRR